MKYQISIKCDITVKSYPLPGELREISVFFAFLELNGSGIKREIFGKSNIIFN